MIETIKRTGLPRPFVPRNDIIGIKFRGDFKSSTLYLVHSLEEFKMAKTLNYLQDNLGFKQVKAVHVDEIEQLLELNKDELVIYSYHLSLDHEIEQHKQINDWALINEIYQLNPYNKIAKIFDDKYLFYVLMIANEIKQAYTVNLMKSGAYIDGFEFDRLDDYNQLFVKPRHGTENIDNQVIALADFDIEHPAIKKIRGYDDALIQEYIDFDEEIKVLNLFGQLYSNIELGVELKDYIFDFIDVIESYANQHEVIMPQVFSMDILRKKDQYYMLEANIRVGAMYRFESDS